MINSHYTRTVHANQCTNKVQVLKQLGLGKRTILCGTENGTLLEREPS